MFRRRVTPIIIAVVALLGGLLGTFRSIQEEPLRGGGDPPPMVVALGDSLTKGAGASGPDTSYPAVASSMLGGVDVVNLGVGDQTSTQIAARMGVLPIEVTLGARSETGWNITTLDPDILYVTGAHSGSYRGTFEGQPATLRVGSNALILDIAEEPKAASGQFVPDAKAQYEGTPVWIWAGRNNILEPDRVLADISAMVDAIGTTPYMVISILPAATDDQQRLDNIARINAGLSERFGKRFIDIHAYLLTMGSGSAADTADVARGMVPTSLRSDAIHLNDAGYSIVASSLAQCWMGGCPFETPLEPPAMSAPEMAAVSQSFFEDRFERDDTSQGSLGPDYILSGPYAGSFPLPPSEEGQLKSGLFLADAGSVVYATRVLPSTATEISAEVSWVDNPDYTASLPATGVATAALLVSPDNAIVSTIPVHVVVSPSMAEFQKRTIEGGFKTLGAIPLSELQIRTDGQSHHVFASVDDTGRWQLRVDATSIEGIDPELPGLMGPYATWEIFQLGSNHQGLVRFHSFQARSKGLE